MIKSLYLLRHAKSSWDNPALHDFDRPLNKRGRLAAPRMAKLMAAQIVSVDMSLVSTAVRARETWNLIQDDMQTVSLQYMTELYMAPSDKILSIIRNLPDTQASLLIVGHNPGLEDLALSLADGSSQKKALKHMREKFPTCGLASFTLYDTSWSELAPDTAQLNDFITPKMLDADGDE